MKFFRGYLYWSALVICSIFSLLIGFYIGFDELRQKIGRKPLEIIPKSYVNHQLSDREINALSSLVNIKDSTHINLKYFSDSIILVNLWTTWCGPCIREMPSLDSLNSRLGGKIQFIIISPEKLYIIKKFLNKFPYKFNMSFYSSSEIREKPEFLDRSVVPYTYVIYQGKILYQERGAKNWNTQKSYEYFHQLIRTQK